MSIMKTSPLAALSRVKKATRPTDNTDTEFCPKLSKNEKASVFAEAFSLLKG